MSEKIYIIPPSKTRYLSEISETTVITINALTNKQKLHKNIWYSKTIDTISESKMDDKDRLIKGYIKHLKKRN